MKFRDIIKSILINENENGPSGEAKRAAKEFLIKFMFADNDEQDSFIMDYHIDIGGDSFVSLFIDGSDYDFTYNFDVNVDSYPSYTPATWDDPADYDPGEYHLVITELIIQAVDTEQVIYKGKDFTNFLTLKMGEEKEYGKNTTVRGGDGRHMSGIGRDGEDFINANFGESIGEQMEEYDGY
jgi:hypothetical protein